MSVSNYFGNKIIDHMLRNQAYTPAATLYLALYTSNPTAADTGSEVSGGSYARQTVAFSAASSRTTSNSGDITFPIATAGWGTVTHFGVRDASSGGNLLIFGALTTPRTITVDNQFVVKAGDLDDLWT